MQDHYHYQLSQLEPSDSQAHNQHSTQLGKGVITWSCTSSGETEGMSVPMSVFSVIEESPSLPLGTWTEAPLRPRPGQRQVRSCIPAPSSRQVVLLCPSVVQGLSGGTVQTDGDLSYCFLFLGSGKTGTQRNFLSALCP